MPDGTPANNDLPAVRGRVPLGDIAHSRQSFPACRLAYEVRLSAVGWQGLADLAAACGAAGLALVALRLTAGGTAHLQLGDDGKADLARLDRALAAAPGVRVVTWTTILQF